jgi:ThiF family
LPLLDDSKETVFQQLTESNLGLIPKDLQREAWNARMAVLGVGMGSAIVHQGVMHGFRRFTVADPDTVAFSNLNRQWFTRDQAEHNVPKVDAVYHNALKVNPYTELETYPDGVQEGNVRSIVDDADIIIDAMDPFDALPQAIMLDRLAKEAGKKVIYPIELGYHGVVYVFGPDTMSLEEFLGIEGIDISNGLDPEIMGIVAQNLLKDGNYIAKKVARDYMEGKLAKYPQLPGVTYTAAGRVVKIAFQILSQDRLDREFIPERPYVLAPEPNMVEW